VLLIAVIDYAAALAVGVCAGAVIAVGVGGEGAVGVDELVLRLK
jgi:hypothetical protein